MSTQPRIPKVVADDTGRIAMYEECTEGSDGSDAVLTRYIYSNHLGSASLELDGSGEIISYEEYHPYGTTAYQAESTDIDAVAKRYRYTGKERDEETGLYYHGARYYIPWLCRWSSVDPKQGEMPVWSPYNYGFCNPVTWADSTGVMPDDPNWHPPMQKMGPAESNFSNGLPETQYSGGALEEVEVTAKKLEVAVPVNDADALYTKRPIVRDLVSRKSATDLPKETFINQDYSRTIWGSKAGLEYSKAMVEQEAALIPGGSIGIKTLKGEEITKTDIAYEAIGLIPFGKLKLIQGAGASVYKLFLKQESSVVLQGVDDAVKEAVQYSDDLVRAAQKAYPNLAGKTQLHHITPKYLGGAANGPLVPLDAAYHQQITNAFRQAWPYGKGAINDPVLRRQIIDQVYKQFPLPPGVTY